MGTANINNATITDNIADSDNDGVGDGGGVWNDPSGTFNYTKGMPGSFFTITGANCPPYATVTIIVRGGICPLISTI